MTARNMTRLLAATLALSAVLLSVPAAAADVPIIVSEPVLDLPAPTQAAKVPADGSVAAGRLSQAPASPPSTAAESDSATDVFCGGDQGEAKSGK